MVKNNKLRGSKIGNEQLIQLDSFKQDLEWGLFQLFSHTYLRSYRLSLILVKLETMPSQGSKCFVCNVCFNNIVKQIITVKLILTYFSRRPVKPVNQRGKTNEFDQLILNQSWRETAVYLRNNITRVLAWLL